MTTTRDDLLELAQHGSDADGEWAVDAAMALAATEAAEASALCAVAAVYATTTAEREAELARLYVELDGCGCGGACVGCQRVQRLQAELAGDSVERATIAAEEELVAIERLAWARVELYDLARLTAPRSPEALRGASLVTGWAVMSDGEIKLPW